MYLSHWSMHRRPFSNSHEIELFVPLEQPMLTLTKLRYGVAMELGALCITGPAGVGKSELLHILQTELHEAGWRVAYLGNPQGERDQVLRRIAHGFGLTFEASACDALEPLMESLRRFAEEGARLLLLVDDAQTISDLPLLEDLRMLLNVEKDGVPVLSMILSGQPGLLGKLAKASHFDARMAMKIRVTPLDEEQTKTYVLARLKAAGCARGIFTRKAAHLVHHATGGIPGAINRLCELSLIIAYGLGETTVRPEIVRLAAADLGMQNDIAVQRMLDEVWGDEMVPAKESTGLPHESDILAELDAESNG